MSLPASGLTLQLDAAMPNIAFNGSNVAGWNDSSSSGNDGSQSSAALQGPWENNGWGSYPSVRLNGQTNSHHITFDTGTIPADLTGTNKPYTINIPLQIVTAPLASNRYILSAGNSGTDIPFIACGHVAALTHRFYQRSDLGVDGLAESATATDLNRHQFTYHFDGTTRTLYLDGVSIATNASALAACTFNRFTLGILRRSGVGAGVDFRTPGMQIYSRALSADELRDVWRYNRAHFGGLTLASDLLRAVTYVEIGAGALGLLKEAAASAAFAEASAGLLAMTVEAPVAATLQETGAGIAGLTAEALAAASVATLGEGAAVLISESPALSGRGAEVLTLPNSSSETLQ